MRPITLCPVAIILATLAGCATNSSRVQRFDPAPTSIDFADETPTVVTAAAGQPLNIDAPRSNAGKGTNFKPTTRTGPITPEWLAVVESTGNRAMPVNLKVPGQPQQRQAFDRSALTFTASTDPDTPADAAHGLTQVTFASEGADFDPRIGKDGQTLVFASTQHRPTADIYSKKLGGRAITQLTNDPGNDVMPALSPDSRRIAFASDRNGSWQVFVMAAQGGRAVQISPDGACDLHPTWSPDGRRIAFCRLGYTSGRWEIWVVEASNPATAEFIGYGMFPVWSPVAGTGEDKSDKIAFQRGKERGDRAFGIWTVDYKPGFVSSPTEIVSASNGAAMNPNWSPDGRFITFATAKPNQPGGVWVVAADGSAAVNVSGGSGSAMSPWWGTDGRVYFVSDRNGTDNIWSVGTERALAALLTPSNTQPIADSGENTASESTASVPTNP